MNKVNEIASRANGKSSYSDKVAIRLASQKRKLQKNKENLTKVPDKEECINIFFNQDIKIPNNKKIFSFEGDLVINNKLLQQNMEFEVVGPEKVAIVGNNGAGKSTLLKKIYKDLIFRKDINIGYMPQNYEDLLDDNITPIEFLGNAGENNTTFNRQLLGSLKFTTMEMEKNIKNLSGGQKAKLLISSFIVQGCNVLLLDEPTRNLSPLSTPIIKDSLKDFKGTIISVSHDREFIDDVCDRVYSLEVKKS